MVSEDRERPKVISRRRGTIETSVLFSRVEGTQKSNVCFVTETDIDRRLDGAIANDLKTLNCLRKLNSVDTVYLQRERYRSDWLALSVFLRQILQRSFEHYQTYFSRGLISSFTLIMLKPIHQGKVIHNALSVPFPSLESEFSNRNRFSGFVWFSLMRFLEQVVTRNADAIIVAADSYAAQLLAHGVPQNRVHTVPFYVEDEFFQQPVKSELSENFTFCYIGGFQPYHFLLPIIEAFKNLHESNSKTELYLVGEGPMRSDVENEVSKRELTGKIRFLGSLPHSSIPNLLSKVDSLIVPTTYGISTNLLEAAAAGKAIITLKRRGDPTLEHYFRQGKEILYVEETSPNEIAEAMRLVLDNPKLRNALSLGARKIAKQYFNEQACLVQLQKLAQEIGNPALGQFPSITQR